MDTTPLTSDTDQARGLAAGEPAPVRRSRWRAELQATTEAMDALERSATRASADSGASARALVAAQAVRGHDLRDPFARSDDAAHDRLGHAVASPEFLALLPGWVRDLRGIASTLPGTGACTIASAIELWLWTVNHFRSGQGALAETAASAIEELAEAFVPLLAARCLTLEIAADGSTADAAEVEFRSDLCHVYAAHSASRAGAVCAEIVFGYRRHLRWDAAGCATCYCADELDELEGFMPGIASGARTNGDVIEADGSHPEKAGPCVRFDGVETFTRLRTRLDGCLTGWRLARDRAAANLERFSVTARTPGKVSEGRA